MCLIKRQISEAFFKFKAWLSIDQPDTYIAVQIYEIKADGSSIALASDALRALPFEYRQRNARDQGRDLAIRF